MSQFELEGDDLEWFEPSALARRRVEARIAAGNAVLAGFQVFAEIAVDGAVERVGGTAWGPVELSTDIDPTTALIDEAYDGRDHLGDLYGDLRIASLDVSRWDFWSAPFRVEITDDIRARFPSLGGRT